MQHRILLTLAAATLAGSGCQGCSFPFDTTTTGTIRLSMHQTDAACTGSGTDTFGDDTPDDPSDDSTVDWNHQTDTDHCDITSTWSGVLVAMQDVKKDVDDAVTEAGFDPETVSVNIKTIKPTIDHVALIDDVSGDADPDVTAAMVDIVNSYAACVNLDGTDCTDLAAGMLSLTTEGGSVTEPVTTVNDPAGLTDAANAALSDGNNVEGIGLANAVVTMIPSDLDPQVLVVPQPFQALTQPTLLITLTFEVNGDAIIGGQ